MAIFIEKYLKTTPLLLLLVVNMRIKQGQRTNGLAQAAVSEYIDPMQVICNGSE